MSREIAILLDGGFVTKRLSSFMPDGTSLTPARTVEFIRSMCEHHVRRLRPEVGDDWHRHLYRIFYYDAPPFEGTAHHPLTRKQIKYKDSPRATFQNELLGLLRKERNVAVRLGHLAGHNGWTVKGDRIGKLLEAKSAIDALAELQPNEDGSFTISPELMSEIQLKAKPWQKLTEGMVQLDLRQKGVDMRIGLDIASLTLKRLAGTIVLMAGDADFVPAAKLARREGLQFILDPIGYNVSDDLFEHIDDLHTSLNTARDSQAEEPAA